MFGGQVGGGLAKRVGIRGWRLGHAGAKALLVSFCLGGAAAAAASDDPAVPAELAGRAVVVDGDSLHVGGYAIRLHGIDAPEKRQSCRRPETGSWACGRAATGFLESLADRGEARCEVRGKDRYGRLLAVCSVGETDFGAALVEHGYAVAYRRYSEAYASQEDAARAQKVGIWAGPFVRPDRWRRGERLPGAAAETSGADCRIKGNVSKSGRIYHLPGSADYARTRIDPARGERWFCTVAEAEAAGWRAPRR